MKNTFSILIFLLGIGCISPKVGNIKTRIIQYTLISNGNNLAVFQNRIINDTTFVRQPGYCTGSFALTTFKPYPEKVDTFYFLKNGLFYYFDKIPRVAFSNSKFQAKKPTMLISKYKYGKGHYLAVDVLIPYSMMKIDGMNTYIYKTTSIETFKIENYEYFELRLLQENKFEELDLNYKISYTYFCPEKGVILSSEDTICKTRMIEYNTNDSFKKFAKGW
jgi:hypothetical protein